jgi:hypothetical protein
MENRHAVRSFFSYAIIGAHSTPYWILSVAKNKTVHWLK